MLNFVLNLMLSYGPNIVAAAVGIVLSLIMIKRRGSLYALFGFLAMLVAVGLGTVDLVYFTWFASHDPDTAIMVGRVITGAADVVALGSWALILVALFRKPEAATTTARTGGAGAAPAGWPGQPAGPTFGSQPPAGPAPSQPGGGQPVSGQPAASQPGVGQPGAGQPAPGQPGTGQPGGGQPGTGFGQPQPGAPGFGGGNPGAQWGQPGSGPSPY
ncbi:hypothetical protein Athai_64030 [Actinocatenispora thailandica]|uniref:Uncharacterized protein n=1 Tax=Actinocatenispora thailandica TaxID=227318 RepID=A0A7R7DWI5_9ACTN|nr:hypothetical protein [Actinocatenispora thailandica]BCJ38900.1 hypothetical protein Athai_64030 [Actinocatenispora thailandica]